MPIDEIVDHYIRHRRASARNDLIEFERLRALAQAIHHASLCHWLPSRKRHPHQYRIPLAALQSAERELLRAKNVLARAKTFEDLHTQIERRIGRIHKVGALAVYDIAHRIAAYRGLSPNLVYLHRGTLAGARILGFSGKTLDPRSLPSAFSHLKPYEIEDCLCIYKDDFRTDGSATRATRCRPVCADRPTVRPRC